MSFHLSIRKFAEEPITRQLITGILKEYKRPNDKIHELIKEGILIPVKRGLYVPGPKLDILQPEPFLLANHIYGPSYVSLESALSYWGLIPEKVYETSSVTIRSSKIFRTEIGRYSYHYLGLPYYAFGIQRVMLTPKQAALVASPEKALCDKIITTSNINLRSKKQVLDFLLEDLRIEEGSLLNFDLSMMESWIEDAPKKNSLKLLVKTLQGL